ncbi:6-phosphogluconolactonase [Lentzea fradiae]|uniref:6-phosphogluconolactonase n=1 Tax=Lentzea fradiae TaxID=200378 RepID=A0A1G7XQK3_9PSEU|nr:lactonase family protein [Lentzea fradiae]SDG85940.1 6-phosphogluconolactonase [Lentzea fradiae]
MTGGTAAAAATKRVFFGAYTTWNGGAKGIGVGTYDTTTGQLEQTGVIPGVVNPSFVIESADGRFLYAVNETSQGEVTAIDATTLQVVNKRPTGGADPCHLTLDPSGKHLITADYSSGSLSVFPVGDDGSLGERTQKVQHEGSGPNPDRQEGPHAHHIVFDPAGKYAAAVDLGADSVFFYTFADGRLEPFSTAKLAPGAGPRHIAFHPDGERAYVANELDSTIVACAYADGTLTPGQVLKTVPEGAGENFPAEVLVSADGRFVYLSNRGHDSVARFAVEGELSLVGFTPVGGEYPRHITFDPSGKFLFAANQNSSVVTSFAVDAASGELTPSGTPLKTEIPVCVLPTGR